jgi:hypothetical protein
MRTVPLAVLALLCPVAGTAQPGPFLQADLQFAAHVCTDTTYTTDEVQGGMGNVADLDVTNRGCLSGGERSGVWMHFQIATAGQLGLTIAPPEFTDYDFAVWGPFEAPPWTLDATPLRCSYSAVTGPVGLNFTSVDLSEGAGGDGRVRYLDVLPGEWYVLYVDNFSLNGLGFDLTWQLQEGATLACLPVPEAAFTTPAAPVLPGESVAFTDQSTNFPFAWQWDFPGGLPASSTERDPQGISYSAAGCQEVQLTVYNAAGSATTTMPCAVLVEISTGVAEAAPGSFTVRQEAMQLRISPMDEGHPVELLLLDVLGRVVQQRSGQGAIMMSTEALAPGRYTVLCRQNGSRHAQAVMLGL